MAFDGVVVPCHGTWRRMADGANSGETRSRRGRRPGEWKNSRLPIHMIAPDRFTN
ncbi:hypothetical protein RPHASCH2410_CH12490 [Rhizobium phaseoli Ch24-10]|nr:hypothetical protein RPHASCH2410_CH12490 [Rhizobium phaseoli Ch24-10]